MPTVRKSLEQVRREGGGRVDRRRFEQHTESDVERMAAEDDTLESLDEALENVQLVQPGWTQNTGS